jgi:DNA-binding NtrC family response regulator
VRMSILTISLPIELIYCLQKQANVRSVNGLEEALQSLNNNDFHYIIEDVRQRDRGHLDLACLLGNTTPGTRIVAIASASSLADAEYWQDQGVTVFYAVNQIDLGKQLVQDYKTYY